MTFTCSHHICSRTQMPPYCRFMVAPYKRTLGDVVPDHNSKMFSRCWRKLRHAVRHYTGSVISSPDSEFSNSEMSTQSEKPFHTPVMVKEVLQFLGIKPGQVVLDLTFGAGDHSKAILQSVPGVTVVAADCDPKAFQMEELQGEKEGRVKPVLGRLSELNYLLPALGLGPDDVDAALLDSSPCRWIQQSGELVTSSCLIGLLFVRRYPDMPCAADVVNALDQQALASMLAAYGEERHTRKIVAAIAQARIVFPIGRTLQLASIVAGVIPASAVYTWRHRLQCPSHVATKTFQALRISVNDELNELQAGLSVAQTLLCPKGERRRGDRMREQILGQSSEKEVQENPRAQSAKLRTAVRQYKLKQIR
uniref:Methyltransferase like 15 n=1 Tax=Cyprinus carpio TaxID=7962 RepID=A0A8C1RCL2_CYPCA